jgi:hypothetical protein
MIAGCAATTMPFPPTLTVPLPDNDFGSFALNVYDDTGLVVAGQASDEGLGGSSDPAVAAIPERSVLVLGWTGGACSHRPYLEVRGDAQSLDLAIAPEPFEMSLAPVQCPAVGIPFEVTLTLSEPVEQANIELTEHR